MCGTGEGFCGDRMPFSGREVWAESAEQDGAVLGGNTGQPVVSGSYF